MRRPRLIEIVVVINLLIAVGTAIVVYRLVNVLSSAHFTVAPAPSATVAPPAPGAPSDPGPIRYSPNGTPLPPGATTGAAPLPPPPPPMAGVKTGAAP